VRPPNRKNGLLLRVAYDGQSFSGLAIQDNAVTVAGELQRSIWEMDPEATRLRVCSRTDAGVHAEEQYVAFDTDRDISCRGWVLGITGSLPPQIAVLSAARIEPGFEPCKRSVSKTYRYSILQGTIRDPFLEGRSWRVFERLNHRLMREEAALLIGTHDFRAFRGRNDFRTNTVRTIFRVNVALRAGSDRVLDIELEGTAFMYHMVRIIAGSVVDVGRGKLPGGCSHGNPERIVEGPVRLLPL
jgi:tRNA pseudouridine38-40 synthase